MKKKLTALLLALTTAFALGHGGVELGPNGGRLLELSKNETTHGEVTVKDGKFVIAVLDKDQKPVKVEAQTLTATSAPKGTAKGTKLEVTKTAEGFTLPVVKEGEWLILQYKEDAKAKAVTARLHYDTGNCDGCSQPEWLCKCKADEHKDEKGGKKEDEKKEAPKKTK